MHGMLYRNLLQVSEMTPFDTLALKDDQMRIFCLIGFQVLSNCYSEAT